MTSPDHPEPAEAATRLRAVGARKGMRFGFPVVVCFGLPVTLLHMLLGALSRVPARWLVCCTDPEALNDVALHCPSWMDVRTCLVPAFDAAGAGMAISVARESVKADRSCIWVGGPGTYTPGVPDIYCIGPSVPPPVDAEPAFQSETAWIASISDAVADWHAHHGHRPCERMKDGDTNDGSGAAD